MAAKLKSTPGHSSSDLSRFCLAIAEHAPLPMAAIESAGHLVRYVNPAFCHLMNKSREELVGKPFSEKIPDNDECVARLDRVSRTGKSESHTQEVYSETHPIFWSYTMWPVIADDLPTGVMILVSESAKLHEQTVAMNEALMLGSLRQHELTEAADSSNARLQAEISERKLAERALRRAKEQLRDRAGQLEELVAERTLELTATNKQLEAFVYSIAHDLRAPLRSMQGFATMLIENAGTALSETGRDFADRISQSAQFMDALLNDLLAFSQISQQRVELTPVNLGAVVTSVLARLQKDIQEKNAHIESATPWPVVPGHEPTLTQVLFNLTSNALKFVGPGVPPEVRLRVEDRSEFVRVWVEDNGVGIAPDYQDQIFRLFTRLNGEKYPGTGVGLAIVQKGVERMGGRVGVESAPGHGSRFWIELPKNMKASAA